MGSNSKGTRPNGASRQLDRDRMVDHQLAPRGIRDARVLAVMREVPREYFVPDKQRHEAYADCSLPIGEGQTISQPYIVARTCELAAIEPQHRVLEIGAGSGYQAAILSRLAREVFTIERVPRLAEHAREVLTRWGASNVRVVTGDGSRGFADAAPYDAIVVAAGTEVVSDEWVAQLVDHGRIVVPLGPRDAMALTVVTRHGDEVTREVYDRCMFVPLIRELVTAPKKL